MNDASAPRTASEARAAPRRDGDAFVIDVSGTWRLRAVRPDAAQTFGEPPDGVRRVVVGATKLDDWDSSLVLFVQQIRARATDRKLGFETRDLPNVFNDWLARLDAGTASPAKPPESFPITRGIGRWAQHWIDRGHALLEFLGESVLGLVRLLAAPRKFRWADCVFQMRRCGAQALGIVALITFLVGVIIAFMGAMQFRQAGADIFVADLVGIAMLRELGPIMAAIVLAGRTGAAYAAELGNMRLNEEIDALETFGLRPIDFLVMPRMVALTLMMPLLTVYADFFGVLGGGFVCGLAIDMSAPTFFHRIQEAVNVKSFAVGLLKSICFGMLVAYAGCLKGMNATRSAIGVGDATTAAVVLGILLIIIANATFTVLFHILGW